MEACTAETQAQKRHFSLLLTFHGLELSLRATWSHRIMKNGSLSAQEKEKNTDFCDKLGDTPHCAPPFTTSPRVSYFTHTEHTHPSPRAQSKGPSNVYIPLKIWGPCEYLSIRNGCASSWSRKLQTKRWCYLHHHKHTYPTANGELTVTKMSFRKWAYES